MEVFKNKSCLLIKIILQFKAKGQYTIIMYLSALPPASSTKAIIIAPNASMLLFMATKTQEIAKVMVSKISTT